MYVGLDPLNHIDPTGMCRIYCPFNEQDPESVKDWFQNATLGSRVLYYIFNGTPSIDITSYTLGEITMVPGFGANASICSSVYTHNGLFVESGIVVVGQVLFGFDIDIGATTSVVYGPPEDGLQLTWSLSFGPVGASGGSQGADTVEASASPKLPFPGGVTVGGAIVNHIPIKATPAGEEGIEQRVERSALCPPSRIVRGCGME